MKCQRCGINDVSFHFSSNINGAVTQTHLCSECAKKYGYGINKIFEEIVSDMLPAQGISSLHDLPAGFMTGGFTPYSVSETKELMLEKGHISIDERFRERRELNAQLSLAIQNEDFEKAAILRDKLKELSKEKMV